MNHTFSGLTLLTFVVFCTMLLFVIGLFIKPKGKKAKSRPKHTILNNNSLFKSKSGALRNASQTQLTKLKKLISKHFMEFQPTLRQNHIVLERASQKVAMLTIDEAAAIGRRRLGNIIVINFHQLPSIEELRIELGGV